MRSSLPQAGLALVCLGAGIAPLAARWIPDDVARIVYGLVLSVVYLACALYAKRQTAFHRFWEVAFAFFVLAVVQVLNNSIPGFVASDILHAPPNAGNPLASTLSATVVVQLLGTLIAIVPVVGFTLASGRGLTTIYARPGRLGWWFGGALVFCVLVYAVIVTLPLRPGSPLQGIFPANSALTVDRILALTPALLIVSISNGFEEEFLFRGLFLEKYNVLFNPRVANVLQAVVFGVAHSGVSYTPSALLFIVALVTPLGLGLGYLMRATNGVLTPAIVHGGLDMAIYVGFLSYVA